MRVMLKYTVSLVAVGLVGLFALFSAIYCAWLSATPLTPERLHLFQVEFFVWLSLFLLELIFSVVIIMRLLRYRGAQSTSQITSTV